MKNTEAQMTKEVSNYKFSDSTIAQIVQLVQLGILTGTDITDQIRTMRLVLNNEDTLINPCPEYIQIFNENLDRMRNTSNENIEQ